MSQHHQSDPAQQEETFIEHSPLANGMNAAGVSAGVGLVVSAVQNGLTRHNAGALGVFTKYGSTIGLFTAMGAAFSYIDATVANARQKNDAISGAAGGCAAGIIAGAAARSVPMMAGACTGLAALIGTFDAAGRSLAAAPGVAPLSAEGIIAAQQQKEKQRQAFFKSKTDASQEE